MQSRIKVFIGLSARALGLIAVLPATAQQATSAPPAATGSTASQATAVQDDLSEIVVTARQRSETLNRVPVVVSVVTPAALEHNNATDLPKIAETVPGLIVAGYSAGGGGTIAIRGISSPPNNAGFEQAVSVAVDGVQTSDGHIALLGMFDLQQVEVLKGPQSLLFGKNNTAGIISIKTADPTDRPLYSIKQAYEFVGDESTTDVVASGPMTDFLGARLAIEYRNLDGWLHNTATPMANPFYNPATGAPANASQLPGASDSRVGNSNVLGRLTFKSELGSAVTARLKIFGAQTNSQGPGVEAQNIGPCSGPYPRIYGVADPTADCKVDNRTTVGDVPAAVASRDPIGNTTGKGFGLETALADTLDLAADLDKVRLNSITGFTRTTDHYMAGADQTDYSQLLSSEVYTIRQISQELRATSKFDGPLNFMVGGFYQGTRIYYRSDITYLTSNYNAASDRFDSYDQVTNQHGSSYSAFAQVLINFTSELELAGGARYTYEKKDFDSRNLYGIGAFATQNTLFAGSDTPGVLRGRFSDHNVSPEVTLTWRPDSNQTYFAAYRTGFKSGGFGLSNPPQTTAIPSDYQFNSETARGGEIGAKLLFLDNRLSVSADAFLYNFDNLQVGVFNPDRFAFIVSNAGALRQRGSELETNFRVNRMLNLRGAVTYA
jgi:iron complex outermembrane recepter protein